MGADTDSTARQITEIALKRGTVNMKVLRRTTTLAIPALLSFFAAGVGVQNASAYCNGVGNPVYWSTSWAAETAASGTCDGLNDYNGKVIDGASDGTCVYVRYLDDGVWTNSPAACSLSLWTNYSFVDTNSYSPSNLCRSSGAGCSTQYANTGF